MAFLDEQTAVMYVKEPNPIQKRLDNLRSWRDFYTILGKPNPEGAEQCTAEINKVIAGINEHKAQKAARAQQYENSIKK